MQERDITKAFDGITPDNELKEKVLEAIENHKPRKFNWDFSRIVPVALCAVVLINGIVLFKSLPEKNNSVIPLDLSSTNISNNMVVDITTTSIPVTETTAVTEKADTDGFAEFYCDYTKGDIVMEMPPDFLDEDAKRLFNEASYLWCGFHKDSYFFSFDLEPDQKQEITEAGYIKSGVSYKSFYNYLTTVYTKSLADLELSNMMIYTNLNGEVGWIDCSWAGDITTGERRIELVSKTNSRVEMKRITNHSWSYSMTKEEFEERNMDGLYEWVEEAPIVMIKTENGWRFEEFSLWNVYGNGEDFNQDLPLETTTEPVIEKKLNLDLLSDIGLTYSQLQEKYGTQVSVFYENSMMYYVFENSSYAYGWSYGYDGDDFLAEERILSFPFSQSVIRYDLTQEEAPLPKAETGCSSINDINCRDLFLGINESSSFSEIEEIYGVRWFKTYPINGGRSKGWEAYVSPFYYDSIGVYIFTKEEGKIDLDSYASISYK